MIATITWNDAAIQVWLSTAFSEVLKNDSIGRPSDVG